MTHWLNKIFMVSLKFFKLITFSMYSIELMSNRDVLNDYVFRYLSKNIDNNWFKYHRTKVQRVG